MTLEHPSSQIHPGQWMKRQIADSHNMTVTAIADHLGVSRQNMSMLFNGRVSLTATMALRFEKAFGLGAERLLRMQAAYDLAQVRLSGNEPDVERVTETA